MIRGHKLVWLAIVGMAIAVGTILYDNRPPPPAPVVGLPRAPYDAYVSGVGMVEASSGNIAIGTPVSGVIKSIAVKVGDHVNTGDALFGIDDLDLQARLITASARVREASASLLKPTHQLENAEELMRLDSGAIGAQRLSDLRDDHARAKAALGLAGARVEQIKIEITRRTVRAPVDGTILQLKMRRGEYMDAGGGGVPALIIGNEEPLYVRVDIDENEAWRIQGGAGATAFVRGNPDMRIALEFEYFEPYVIPKTALTGRSTERTDRRVLQVIYGFVRGDLPVYVGQQLDIYIEAAAVSPEPSGMAR